MLIDLFEGFQNAVSAALGWCLVSGPDHSQALLVNQPEALPVVYPVHQGDVRCEPQSVDL